jgi:hypothetical protein
MSNQQAKAGNFVFIPDNKFNNLFHTFAPIGLL